jgi:hypothetical protein
LLYFSFPLISSQIAAVYNLFGSGSTWENGEDDVYGLLNLTTSASHWLNLVWVTFPDRQH